MARHHKKQDLKLNTLQAQVQRGKLVKVMHEVRVAKAREHKEENLREVIAHKRVIKKLNLPKKIHCLLKKARRCLLQWFPEPLMQV